MDQSDGLQVILLYPAVLEGAHIKPREITEADVHEL